MGVTSDSEIQYPSPPWRQGQGGGHLPETGFVVWGSDGTASTVEGLRPQEARESEVRETGS